MHISFPLLASIVAGVQFVTANPAGTPAHLDVRADKTACAKAASASADFFKKYPNEDHILIPAQIAYDCLKSVPLRKDPALDLTRALKPYVQFQSTIDYLRFPPSGYLWDAVDVPRLLAAIETKLLSKDTYDNEYDFQLDLQSAFIKARDGHFTFKGDLVNTFSWSRPAGFNLVSLSLDGLQVPQVYAASDIIDIQSETVTLKKNYKASAIKTINGLDVEKFTLAESNARSTHDPDNMWNGRFFHIQGYFSNSFVGGFNRPALYPGPTTVVEFQNGTKVTLDNMAIPLKSLAGISTGDDMYKKFCNPKTAIQVDDKKKRDLIAPLTRRDSATSSSSWPAPYMADSSGAVSGYFFNDTEIAVLAVYSFYPGKASKKELDSFQDAVTNFFANAVKKGKKKLIIDLQGNTGGSIDLSIDLAAQLFPTVPPNSKDNMRASIGMHGIMVAASAMAAAADKESAEVDAIVDFKTVPFSYQEVMTPDVKNFNRLSDYYGPTHIGHGLFTNFFQGNYTNDSPSQFGIPGVVITGTNSRKNFKQPFKAEDIIMLTDGACASACTIFSEKMKQQGVQVITMGGRPQTGPMQAIGATKGSQFFGAPGLGNMLDMFSDPTWNTELTLSKGTMWDYFNELPLNRSGNSIGINGRNQFRIGDTTQTPLQFVYEAADCRIFETPEMVASPVAIWSRVARLAFENRKDGVIDSQYCVKDSTKQPTSLSGGLKKGEIGSQTPPANAKSKVTGFLLNGKDIVDSLASGKIDNKSPVNTGVAVDGDSTTNGPEVLAAVETMTSVCKGYTGTEWFVKLICAAITKQGGSS